MIKKFSFNTTTIDGLIKIQSFDAQDERGFFTKDYSKEIFEQNGYKYDLKEVFYTTSFRGVIRALHFQRTMQQAKLVRCITGKIFDVIVDLRENSKTFGCWESFILSQDNKEELLIPSGCAHGYLVLEDSIVSYKCNEKFYGEYDDGIKWNDSKLAIEWPLNLIGGLNNLIISEKDKNLQSFEDFVKTYQGLK